MRLFWKLFCSMVIIAALACSVGGFVLIDDQFRTSLDREVTALYEENDLLRYTLARELEQLPGASQAEFPELVSHIRITTGRGTVAFRISDRAGETVVTSGVVPVEAAPLTGRMEEGHRGWELAYAWGDGSFSTPPAPWRWTAEVCTWKTAGRSPACLPPGRSSIRASSA